MRRFRLHLFPQVVLLLAIAGIGSARAQDFQTIAPKPPPKAPPGKIVNEQAGKHLAAGDEILVRQLKGVVLLSSPKEVKPDGVTSKQAIEPGDVALAENSDFENAVSPWIGKPVTMTSLAELTRSIVAYFRAHDRPVVNVYVPQQSITRGFVQIVVVQTKVEKVDATGAHYFSNAFLKSEIDLQPGEPISGQRLRGDLAWINRNPFLQADMLMAPGDAPGTTDLLLRTRDRFPLRVYAGYENSGNDLTGNDRFITGFNYGNLFGVGQQLSYQFTVGRNYDNFYAHAGTYVIPLPWKHQLTFFGSYSSANSDIGNSLATGGVTWQVSGRYEIPLPGTEHLTHSVSGGFDFKRTNNDLIFGGTSVSTSFAEVDQFVLSYQGTYTDDYGLTSFTGVGYYSPGEMSSDNNDPDFQSIRPGASASYLYGQVSLTRITRLPADFTWTMHALGQVANSNLLPTEELGLGGYSTVRGYQEREANGDQGFLFSNEVATPPVSLAALFGDNSLKDELQFFAFLDYGGTTLYQVEPGDSNPSVNLLSVGPGMRYNISPYLTFRFDYGFQLIQTGFGNGEHGRADMGVVVSY